MNYSGINAKIKGMMGKLLTADDYRNMCAMKSVPELGLYLKNNTVYGPALESIPENDIHREPIEQKIVLSLHDDFARMKNFTYDFNAKKYLNRFFLRNEIYIVKLLLCMIYDERDITYTIVELQELLDLKIDLTRLKNAKTVPEFIEGLKGTPFFDVLNRVYQENTTLFQLEVQLDLFYFFQLRKAIHSGIDRQNAGLLRLILGTETDLRNIMWVYRIKSSYAMPPNTIYSILIPNHFRLKGGQINSMAESGSMEALAAEIARTPYGSVFEKADSVEAAFYRRILKLHKALVSQNPSSLANLLSYVFYKELEIKNIISIMEGIRYSLEPEKILRFVIFREWEGVS